MKYIFCAGAPGSKWSSLIKNIYYSPSVDRSDYSEERTYYHDGPTFDTQLMHLGAYFDPGMEFEVPADLSELSKFELERRFDEPFNGEGIRIIKAHTFAHNIDYLKINWPDCPIILADRDDDACLGWWVRCGEFNITYPLYHKYYQNLRKMSQIIDHQNADIRLAWNKYSGSTPQNNLELVEILKIAPPQAEYQQNYASVDLKVKVI